MEKESKFLRDENGYVAVRTVSSVESFPTVEPDSMFCRDTNGNVAIRVVGSSAPGSEVIQEEKFVLKYTHMPLPAEVEYGTAGLYVGATTQDYTRGKIYLRTGADLPTVEFELSTTGLAIDCTPADFTTFLASITDNYAEVRRGQFVWNTEAPQQNKWFISAFDVYDRAIVSTLKSQQELESMGFEFSKDPSDFEVVNYVYNITGNRDAAVWEQIS